MAKGTTSNVTRKNARRVVAGKTAAAAPSVASRVTEDDVARRAYEFYLAEGKPDGRHVEHWLRAEAELGRS